MSYRCYCCGEPVDKLIALVSHRATGDAVDRVFIMKPDHVHRVDQQTKMTVTIVKRAQREK